MVVAVTATAHAQMRIGNGGEPESLDPQKAQTVSAMNVVRDLYEGLTVIGPGGTPGPGAAERWDVAADGLQYVFHLRAGGRWSDGTPVTAEDFAAALRRAVDPASGAVYGAVLAPIAGAPAILAGRAPAAQLGVTAVDPLTLRVQLAQPAPHLPALLALPVAMPLHGPGWREFREGFARPGRMVGNGAFVLQEWTRHARIALVRNPHYWNAGAVALDRVTYVPTEDRHAEVKRFRTGELDATFSAPAVDVPRLRAGLGEALRVAPYLQTYYVGFNCTRAPFAQAPALRQALGLALDRELLVARLLQGVGAPAYGFVPPAVHGYDAATPAWAAWSAGQRLAEARRLYAAAGYGPKHPLRFELRHGSNPNDRRMATIVAAMWRQGLGVDVRLAHQELRGYVAELRQRVRTEAFLWDWVGDYDDATTFLDVLRQDRRQNYTGWSDATYEALLDAAGAQPDAAHRATLLRQAEARLLDAAPLAPLYFGASAHLVQPWVEGWRDDPLDYHYARDLRVRPH
ncbi:MAG TPA: peptide ABC transporter substrate-binding protein [Candidatus Binatia bacterium]|nr:peptide ABC transporter substrate-binding protein [Candidatus Binatia bacterium]